MSIVQSVSGANPATSWESWAPPELSGGCRCSCNTFNTAGALKQTIGAQWWVYSSVLGLEPVPQQLSQQLLLQESQNSRQYTGIVYCQIVFRFFVTATRVRLVTVAVWQSDGFGTLKV